MDSMEQGGTYPHAAQGAPVEGTPGSHDYANTVSSAHTVPPEQIATYQQPAPAFPEYVPPPVPVVPITARADQRRLVLTRATFLATKVVKIEWVETPEKGEGEGVYVKGLTSKGSADYQRASFKLVQGKVQPTNRDMNALLVALTACDDAGTLVFEPGDAREIEQENGAVVERIARVARELSGLNRNEEQKDDAREDLDGTGADA